MSYTEPTVSNFKTYFERDFPYGSDIETQVTDTDIEKGIDLAKCNINPDLFADEDCYKIGFLLLSAHYLVENLRSSSQGLNGQFSWLQNSKSVGSVSVGNSIPDKVLKSPFFSMLTKTNYGAQYLEMVYPYLTGPMSSVKGGTRP